MVFVSSNGTAIRERGSTSSIESQRIDLLVHESSWHAIGGAISFAQAE